MIEVDAGTNVLLGLQLGGGSTNLFPQAVIYDAAGLAVGTPVNLTHVANGLYQATLLAPAVGNYDVAYTVFTDAGHTAVSFLHNRTHEALRVVVKTEDQVWDALAANHVAAGSLGANLDAKVTTRATQADILSDATPFAGADVAAILADTAAMQPTVAANLDAQVSTRATPADILSDAIPFAGADVAAILADTAAMQPTVAANLDAAVSSRSSHTPAAVEAAIAAAHGAGSYTTATGFAVAGDAMALTPTERTAIDSVLAAAHGAGQWDAVGTALTAQQVRDAMKLAPSAGAPSVGSIDLYLSDVLADTSVIQPTVAANLDAAVSSRSSHAPSDVEAAIAAAHGAGSYATATGFAVAGDAMALTPSERTALVDSMLNEPTANHTVPGSIGQAVADGALYPATGAIAAAVWDEPLAGHNTAGSAGLALSGASAPSAATVAAAVWDEALPGTHAAGTAGERLATTDDRVDTAVSSRSSHTPGDVDAALGASHGTGQWDGVSDWTSTEKTQIRGALGIVGTQSPPSGGGTLQTVAADIAAVDGRVPASPADEATQLAQHAATQAAIAGLNDLSQAGVQAALTAQGYTVARAPKLDSLDAAVSSRAVPGDAMALIADAVNSGTVAPSAAAEIGGAVWDEAQAAHTAPGTFGANVDAAVSSRAAPGDAMTLTPAERVSSAGAVWDEPLAAHNAAGSAGLALSGASAPSAGTVAAAVWDEAQAGHVAAGTFGAALDAQVSSRATQADILSDATPFAGANVDAAVSSRAVPGDAMALTPAERVSSAGAVWDEALPGTHAAGTAGERLATTDDRVDTAVSSRAAPGDAMVLSAGGIVAATLDASALTAIAGAAWDEPLAGHNGIGSAGRALSDAEGAVNVPTAANTASAVWDEARASHALAGTFGEALDAQVSSRAVPGDAMALTPAERVSSAGAVWDEALPGTHAAGTAGERLATTDDRVDTAVSSRATQADILSDATPFAGSNLDAQVSSRAVPGDAMALSVNALDSAALDVTARDAIAGQVWDEARAAHTAPGTFGESITANDAVAIAGAVWEEVLTGHIAVGSAGEALKAAFAQAGGDVRDDALTYDANDRPLTIRRRIFPDAATAAASTPGGTGEGEIMTFTYSATHTSPARWESLERHRT